jgi:hypothetical protein
MCFGDWCRQQVVSDMELTAALSSTDKKGKAKEMKQKDA